MATTPDIATLRSTAATITTQRAQQLDTVTVARQQLAAVNSQIAAAPSDQDAAALQAQQAAAQQKITVAQTAITNLNDQLRQSFPITLDPCACSSDLPLLLLPIRIETRFAAAPAGVAGTTLNIRIFPDTVHVDSLRRSLTDSERAAGIAYWTALWPGQPLPQAWTTLQLAVGAARAGWVAEATRPTNAASAPGGAPAFPDATAIKDSTTARLLPDRFVAVARQGGKEFRATGNPIVGDPEMGAFQPDEADTDLIVVNGVTISPTAKWIVDFPTALAQGLAIALPLPSSAAVDDLFVFGVRQSLDATTAANELDDLLTAHRYSVGLGIVPQGTPTNNLDDTRSGWSGAASDVGPTLTPAAAPSNAGAALAAAFGISGDALADAPNARADEDRLAGAANSIVWNGSVVNFLDGLEALKADGSGTAPTISDATREKIRRLHRDMVRGRGPLPALRIGKQPYGVLPVGATASLWSDPDPFLTQALGTMRNARALWLSSASSLPHVTPGQVSDDATMLSLLGMSPISVGLRGREAMASDFAKAFNAVTGAVDTEDELAALLAGLLAPPPTWAGPYRVPFAILGQSKPIGLPYVDDSDAAALTALAQSPHTKLEVKSVLQALAQLAWGHVAGKVVSNGTATQIGTVVGNIANLAPAQVNLVQQNAPQAAALSAPALEQISDSLQNTVSATATLAEYQPDAVSRTSFSALALSSTSVAGRSELGMAALPAWFLGQSVQAEVIAALTTFAGEPSLDKRRIALAEALDIASHRLDSWATALVESRRRSLRATTPKGLHVGAFGWVQNIGKGDGNTSGYLHAPSMGQAVTAGILRSAYLSHNQDGDPASDGSFAIDLSSARVRDGMDLLDAVREGQGLSTALGYRIERGLHDNDLDRLVLNLRALAPLSAGQLVDDGQPPEADIASHLAMANIVDGVALIDKAKADFSAIVAACNAPPADNPYVSPQGWPALTANETTALQGIITDAAGALDAVSDILLAESVHQLAQGNMARASAAADAAANGDSPVPVPDVVATPGGGDPVTHRLLLAVQDGTAWSTTQPRAVAEPMLERWAAARLGSADAVIAVDGAQPRTLKDTGLAALDLVYGSADQTALQAIIRARLGVAPDAVLVDDPADGWAADKRALGDVIEVAAALRTVLASASPALPGELGLPSATTPGREISDASLAEALARGKAARATLAQRSDALSQALAADPVSPDALVAALIAIADFGIMAPAGSNGAIPAQLAVQQATQRLANADALLATTPDPDMLGKLAAALFGDGFWILALTSPVSGAAADEWDAALAQKATLATPSAIRRWLADVSAVRAPSARFGDTLLLADALGTTPTLSAMQIAGPGESQQSSWIGSGPADGTVVSYVIEESGWSDPTRPVAMLMLDHFVERLPGKDAFTSAVAFDAPSPNARAPQAWLMAIPPDTKAWTTDSVLATLRDTVDLAKIRGVALEHQPYAARVLPALYQQSWSLQGEDVIDFSKFALVADDKLLYSMRFVKES